MSTTIPTLDQSRRRAHDQTGHDTRNPRVSPRTCVGCRHDGLRSPAGCRQPMSGARLTSPPICCAQRRGHFCLRAAHAHGRLGRQAAAARSTAATVAATSSGPVCQLLTENRMTACRARRSATA